MNGGSPAVVPVRRVRRGTKRCTLCIGMGYVRTQERPWRDSTGAGGGLLVANYNLASDELPRRVTQCGFLRRPTTRTMDRPAVRAAADDFA